MAYVKQTWANGVIGETPLSAARLNHIEDGIETVDSGLATKADLVDVIAQASSRTDSAGELIQARLDTATNDVAIGVAGDSTGNDSNDWVRRWLADIGSARPNLRIEYGLWEATTALTMQTPLAVLQAGTGTPATNGMGIVSDTFTRTAAELGSTTADTGQIWTTNLAGGWSANGTKAVCAGTSSMFIPTGVSGDMTVTASVTIDTTPAAGSKVVALYSNYFSAANNLWTQFNISTGGIVSWTIWKRIANTATSIATGGALGLTPNAVNTFGMQISLAGLAVTAIINGVTANANIIADDLAALGASAGFAALATSTAGATVDDFVVDTTSTPYIGQKLTIYNGSKSGTKLDHAQANVAAMYPTAPDVLIINSGHNYGTDTPATYLTAVNAFVTALHVVHPDVLLIASSQNPQFTPRSVALIAAHAARLTELRVEASKKGWGYLPILETFLSQPDNGLSKVSADGIHPTTTGGADGAKLWADRFAAYLASKSLLTV